MVLQLVTIQLHDGLPGLLPIGIGDIHPYSLALCSLTLLCPTESAGCPVLPTRAEVEYFRCSVLFQRLETRNKQKCVARGAHNVRKKDVCLSLLILQVILNPASFQNKVIYILFVNSTIT
jgi:hypothetical protein